MQRVARPIGSRRAAGGASLRSTYWTAVDRDYETLRSSMHTLFDDRAVTTEGALAALVAVEHVRARRWRRPG